MDIRSRNFFEKHKNHKTFFNLANKINRLNVFANEPVRHVKELVQDKLHIAVDRQNLLFKRKQLDINKRLSDYRVPNRGVLHLQFRKENAPPHPKPNPNAQHVIVRHEDGHQIRFDVSPKEPVKHLQHRIYNRFHVRPRDQRLSHNKAPIDPRKKLGDLHLPNGAIIDLKVDHHRDIFVVFVKHPVDGHKIR
jgi:hypothetical protein